MILTAEVVWCNDLYHRTEMCQEKSKYFNILVHSLHASLVLLATTRLPRSLPSSARVFSLPLLLHWIGPNIWLPIRITWATLKKYWCPSSELLYQYSFALRLRSQVLEFFVSPTLQVQTSELVSFCVFFCILFKKYFPKVMLPILWNLFLCFKITRNKYADCYRIK